MDVLMLALNSKYIHTIFAEKPNNACLYPMCMVYLKQFIEGGRTYPPAEAALLAADSSS